MLAFFSANVYGFESEGFLFDVISEEDLTVELSFVNYSDNLERVDIPATISHEGKTYNVTVIDSTAFQNCRYSTSVISIPETVTHIRFGSLIGNSPFDNCDVLTRSLLRKTTRNTPLSTVRSTTKGKPPYYDARRLNHLYRSPRP